METIEIKNFETLQKISEETHRLIQLRGFQLESILAGLYNEPTHFIFELIQNAEDVKATEILLKLYEDRLEFYHNSKTNFDFENIKAITGIGQSTKKDDINQIGKFGVGFKSVFAITQSPYIYSGEYSICIENFYVPRKVENIKSGEKGTFIILPFNHMVRKKEEVFSLIESALNKLDMKSLIFLKNIKSIYWQTPSQKGNCVKDLEVVPNIPDCKYVYMLSDDFQSYEERYLTFDRNLSFNDKLKISLAFKIGKPSSKKDSKECILPEPNSKLVVYFPTEKVTFMNFLIHGPFRTTPNRENIPFDNIENKKIAEETAALLADSIVHLRELGYLTVSFLELLPLDKSLCKENFLYSECFNKVKESLQNRNLLPTITNEYGKASDVLLARESDLTELLNSEDIQLLYNKNIWLDTSITEVKTKELKNYLTDELGIKEIQFEYFARNIPENFLKLKSDSWITQFYKALLKRPNLLKYGSYLSIRSRKIIRTESNEHIAPYLNNQLNAFLPSEGFSNEKTIKSELLIDPEVVKCMELLDLKNAEIIDIIIETILSKYKSFKSMSIDSYLKDLFQVVSAYKKLNDHDKVRLVNETKACLFILVNKTISKDAFYVKPESAYFCEENLEIFYHDCENKYFISDRVFEISLPKDDIIEFFKNLGVNQKPIKVNVQKLNRQQREELRNYASCTSDNEYNYDLDSLEDILKKITIEKSLALWNLLSYISDDFFKAMYDWSYARSYSKKVFNAYFVNKLNETPWLLDINNVWKAPKDILKSELSDIYELQDDNTFIKYLMFQPDVIEQLPNELRERLELVKNLPLEKWQRVCELINVFDDDDLDKHVIEEAPDQSITEIEDWDFQEVKKGEDSLEEQQNDENTSLNINRDSESSDSNEVKFKVVIRNSSNKNKIIGDWGEKKVIDSLYQSFLKKGAEISEDKTGFTANMGANVFEVKNMNCNGEISEGFDLLIKENGEIKEYIEVKSKSGDTKELLLVTGTQWEYARRLYLEGKGDMYRIYVVSKAGKTDSSIHRIINPFKKWLEGKLYAHPVHLEL
jgi:hypothetical protein